MAGHGIKSTWHLFVEKAAKIKERMTGERWDGLPRLKPGCSSSYYDTKVNLVKV